MRGDKLVQVVVINHPLKADIFPPGPPPRPGRGHNQPADEPYILLHPPPSFLTPYGLQRPLPSSQVHMLCTYAAMTEERIPPSPPPAPAPGQLFQQRSLQQPAPCLVAATASACVQECDNRCETATSISQEMMQHLFCFTSFSHIVHQTPPSQTPAHLSRRKTSHRGATTTTGCYIHKNTLHHTSTHTPADRDKPRNAKSRGRESNTSRH